MANLLNLERVSKAYGVRPLLTDVSLGIAAGRADRDRRSQRRRQDHAARGDDRPRGARLRPGLADPRHCTIGYLHQGDELVDTHSVREAVLGGMDDHEWAADYRTREIVEVLLAGVSLDRPVVGPLRWRAPPVLAGRAAARRPRPDRARRADQPPRRRGGRVARGPPGQACLRDGGGHPRPLVPRRGLPVDVGGARRGGGRLRGRVRRVRAGQGRAHPPGVGLRGASPEPREEGAGLAAPRRRRPAPRSRSSGSRRPTR